MSGPFGVTGWSSLIRLLLLHLCLPWNLVTGVTHHLRCVNDYVLTINCSLSMVPSEYPSDNNYWLRLKKFYGEKFDCMLTKTSGDYFCSVKIHNVTPDHDDYYALTFSDLDIFVISLCRKKSELENCDRLDKEYRPSMNIKPNAPCCLTVSHNSSQCHFSWKGAEEYRFTGLTKTLMYQLQYFKTGDNNDTSPQEINTENVSYSVGDEEFESGTQYTGRVRSSPNQASYKGQWSDWSGEVHWRIESTGKGLPSKPFVFGLEKVIITLCVIMMFLVLLGYALIKKWKQRAFIPTPARYFDTLYSDFQGDFKSWVITKEKMGDVLTTEETLKIDTVTKCADTQDSLPLFVSPLVASGTYKNLTNPGCDVCDLGVSYATPTTAPPLTPGSPAEGDSGCWLSNHTSQEAGPPFYYEYCTLSTVQQSNPVKAQHNRRPSV